LTCRDALRPLVSARPSGLGALALLTELANGDAHGAHLDDGEA
jgi:hypothetical protein